MLNGLQPFSRKEGQSFPGQLLLSDISRWLVSKRAKHALGFWPKTLQILTKKSQTGSTVCHIRRSLTPGSFGSVDASDDSEVRDVVDAEAVVKVKKSDTSCDMTHEVLTAHF